ncbi:MAG: glycosyl hydrolase, partial [Flavisolibacter sp.]
DKGPFQEMQIGAKADVPLGEYWYGLSSILQGNESIRRTPKLAASIAHTNDRKLAGAEAFTSEPESSRWQEYPFALKATGDLLYTMGINKMIIHCFVHQPHPSAAPGITMGPWGIHFDRTNTWFEQSKEWMTYNARCQYLLQQGNHVADFLYFSGEESNVYTATERNLLNPAPPAGMDYDLINSDTIINRISIENGWIVLPSGTRYRALVLQDYKAVSMGLLRKLRSLVKNGMLLVGKRPERSLGLHQDDNEFNLIVNELWKDIDGLTIVENKAGKGTVSWSHTTDLPGQLSLQKDFIYSSRSGDAPIQYVHRRSGKTEIYFISNQRRSHEEIMCSFRIKGMKPEVWDPSNGSMMDAVVYDDKDDRVLVPVQLDPYGSLFIIFRTASSPAHLVSIKKGQGFLLQANHFPSDQKKRLSLQDNFSIMLWAKPEMNIMLVPSIHMGNVQHPFTDFYAIYPASGEKLYGKGHATAGLAIGRNGVAVWENETFPELVYVAEVHVSGWSHIALIYEDGTPSVFVNGIFAGRGKKSSYIVHPSSQVFPDDEASYFNGDMSEPVYLEIPANADSILKIVRSEKPPVVQAPVFEMVKSKNKTSIRFYQAGEYRMEWKNGESKIILINNINASLELNDNWKLQFPPGSGAPQEIILSELVSLHTSNIDGIRFFSGTITYNRSFSISEINSEGKRVIIDLGRVEVVARVKVNNKDFGILWKRPYRIDISGAIIKGMNRLEISVTTLWPNRLIGDEQLPDPDEFTLAGSNGLEQLGGAGLENRIGSPIKSIPEWFIHRQPKPEDGRITFTTWKHYRKSDPLLESGLIGPVILYTAEQASLNSK